MRASPQPPQALRRLWFPVLAAGAVVVLAGAAAAQSDQPPFETTTRLDALDRVTEGEGPDTCYSRPEAFAVETQRIYAELLVASLACEDDYGLEDGHETYADFSVRHESLLTETQSELERLLGGPAAFDAHVTRLANLRTQELSDFGTTTFCEIHRSRFNSLIDAEGSDLRGYMDELAGRLLARQRGC